MKAVLITLIVAVSFIAIGFMGRDSYAHKQVVYDYCNNSRISDVASERTCGELQDFYHMEFLCDENNKDVGTHCWVEVK